MSETVKVIVTLSKGQYEALEDMKFGSIASRMIFNEVKHGTPLDEVIAKLEEHKYSREYCIEHGIDWAIDMGMVRIILNNIGKESEEA